MQQRQQVERFQEDGEDETGDGTVALAVGEARRGVAGTQYVEMFFQVGLYRKMTADGKDEAVADVQDGVAEAAGKALVAAADADDAGVEAAAEVDFLQGFIDEVGFVRDDRFDEVAGEQVARVFSEDFQAAKGLQAANMLNRAAENELVAGTDAYFRTHRRDEVVVALNFHEIEVIEPLQAAVGDAFAGDVRLRQHFDGEEIGVFDVLAAVAVHRKDAHPPVQHGKAGDRDRNADGAELKHVQRRQSGAGNEGIDDEVGRSANQRSDAAENGGVRERDEQARRRDFLLAGEGGEESGDDGGVVHEG